MMNKEVFKRMTPEAQNELEKAQLEELIERRGVRDPKLFRSCYDAAILKAVNDGDLPEDCTPATIESFNYLAELAFQDYHQQRKTAQTPDDGAPTGEAEESTEGDQTPGEAEDTTDDTAKEGQEDPSEADPQ